MSLGEGTREEVACRRQTQRKMADTGCAGQAQHGWVRRNKKEQNNGQFKRERTTGGMLRMRQVSLHQALLLACLQAIRTAH